MVLWFPCLAPAHRLRWSLLIQTLLWVVLRYFHCHVFPDCHGRVGTLIFILSYLKAHDPERILPYVDRGTFVF